jgi:lysophospholipase L1-like esterase
MKIAFLGDSLTEGTIAASYFKILEKKISKHNLLNYGRNGDPVLSLYKRVKKIDFKDIDIVFIWIGTNDVLVKISPISPIIKTIFNQPWTKNHEEFVYYYSKILELLKNVKKVFTVSLLFLGEDPTNEWNKELDILSKKIKEISKKFSNVKFINLKEDFKKIKKSSDYLPTKSSRLIFDCLFIRDENSLDKLSKKRNLKYTVDGVHLNNIGAKIVANRFEKEILKFSNTKK